ncbi:cytoglobin-1 [Octopus sinensis]|uniref:Cytoglobin-1 n=1 Tax=Octopus sinensis TaxID=2607531 RepID=A0A6P7SXZ1_9MOLL|nr:cytoglobin-1 [Octopus sinensis]
MENFTTCKHHQEPTLSCNCCDPEDCQLAQAYMINSDVYETEVTAMLQKQNGQADKVFTFLHVDCEFISTARIMLSPGEAFSFFESDQELKTFFPKIIQISEKNELEWDVDNDMLQRHGITVMRGLEAAVESLDDSQFLNNVLFRIGQAHVYKNIKPHMLKRLWPSLNRSFKEVLKDRYNKDMAEAWRLTYQYICSQMKNGMKNSSSQ